MTRQLLVSNQSTFELTGKIVADLTTNVVSNRSGHLAVFPLLQRISLEIQLIIFGTPHQSLFIITKHSNLFSSMYGFI